MRPKSIIKPTQFINALHFLNLKSYKSVQYYLVSTSYTEKAWAVIFQTCGCGNQRNHLIEVSFICHRYCRPANQYCPCVVAPLNTIYAWISARWSLICWWLPINTWNWFESFIIYPNETKLSLPKNKRNNNITED